MDVTVFVACVSFFVFTFVHFTRTPAGQIVGCRTAQYKRFLLLKGFSHIQDELDPEAHVATVIVTRGNSPRALVVAKGGHGKNTAPQTTVIQHWNSSSKNVLFCPLT